MSLINILKQLTKKEKIWLGVFSFIILSTTLIFSYLYTDYTNVWNIILNWVISPLSAWTGVFCVLLAAKGHLSTWSWGLINSVSYGLIALISGYYGDWMLNWFYFVPTQIWIYFNWKKHLENKPLQIVQKKTMNVWQMLGVAAIFAVVTYGFSLFLLNVDSWFAVALKRNTAIYGYIEQVTGSKMLGPIIDSISNNLQIFAQILMALCFAEQWYFWIATNVITITMWSLVIILDHASWAYAIPTLIMWVGYLTNNFYGVKSWFKKN